MTEQLVALGDLISALADPYTHAESYPVQVGTKTELRVHRVKMPPLIDQLGDEVEPGGIGADGKSIPSSRPSAKIDVIDRLVAITNGVNTWLSVYEPGRTKEPIRDRLKALVGQPWTDTELRDVVYDARRWLTWAKVSTGWDTRPWAPNVQCLACGERGTLRIRLDPGNAYCISCEAAWDEYTIGLLAEGIRTMNGEKAARSTR